MTRRRIDEHTIQTLEFEQIRQILASYASSSPGKQAARDVYPSLDPQWISHRLEETSEVKQLLQENRRLPLAGIHDLMEMFDLLRQKQSVFEPEQLLAVSDTLTCCASVKSFFNEFAPEQYPQVRQIVEKLEPLPELVEQINAAIQSNGTVRSEASPRLQEVRSKIVELRESIQHKLKGILGNPEKQNALENRELLIRNGRAVIAVKTNYRQWIPGTVLDRSHSGATLYLEPAVIAELSNELEDQLYEEKKEIDRILSELTHLVLQQRDTLVQNTHHLAMLDLTVAKARFSIDYDMNPARVELDTPLELMQARHPLLMQLFARREETTVTEAMNKVVPIDVRLGRDFDMLLITGPNTGGKTVTLKTIGLLALMNQSGLHIPARSDSHLPIYRQVFVDIGDEQSLEQSLSTFSGHILQVVDILQRAGKHALVLLDELGAGTDPEEGGALAVAILDKLLEAAGHIVVTTHLSSLKNYAFNTPRVENASVQFNLETLEPTYELMIGTPGSSNALTIAGRLGLARPVIAKAKSHLSKRARGTTFLINQVQRSRELSERHRAEARALLERSRAIYQLISERLERSQAERDRLIDQANDIIDQSMRRILKRSQEYHAHAQNAPDPWKQEAEKLLADLTELAAAAPLACKQKAFLDTLGKGDRVYLLSLDCPATVLRMRKSRQLLTCMVDGKEVDVPFADAWPIARTV